MDKNWRKKHFQKHPGSWFKVPVRAFTKQSPHDGGDDGDDVDRKRKKSSQTTIANNCVPGCLLLCVQYMGLDKHTQKMTELFNRNLRFNDVLHCFEKMKGFERRKVKGKKPFDPVTDTDPGNLYVIQISSQFEDISQSEDNCHCISIFDGRIFDNNIQTPLELSKDNLNKCCVGGPSYVFHHCSRVVQFAPTIRKKKLILRNLGYL